MISIPTFLMGISKRTQTEKTTSVSTRSIRVLKSSNTSKSAKASDAYGNSKAEVTSTSAIQDTLRLGYLLSEKCELKEAEVSFNQALKLAKRTQQLRGVMEAMAGLLRIASEALDEEKILKWENDLDSLMSQYPTLIPPMAWYCKGVIVRRRGEFLIAQRYFRRYLKMAKAMEAEREGAVDSSGSDKAEFLNPVEHIARGWSNLAMVLSQRGRRKRARFLAEYALKEFEARNFRSINGVLYLTLGNLAESELELDGALSWYKKAHASFMAEHNWYFHLYVLYGYARVARLQQNYVQAYWYLDLMEKATASPSFGVLRRELEAERNRLEEDAVDLLIDGRKGVIKTREGGQITLRKQYILLHILEALSQAHGRSGTDADRGLSKAEIIQKVWKETYRPEAHDNKLYYNINRLRKLIERDTTRPQYLLNWKEGYRLAPGLRVHFIGSNIDGAQYLDESDKLGGESHDESEAI